LGDSLVFFGDFGDLALGDSVFFLGDFVALAFAALAFLGDVASFLGLDVVVFLVVEAFFATVFFGDLAFVAVDFLGDLVAVVDDFFELDVDLFLGEDGAVVEVPDVACVDVDVAFFVVDFFFLSFLAPGASL